MNADSVAFFESNLFGVYFAFIAGVYITANEPFANATSWLIKVNTGQYTRDVRVTKSFHQRIYYG